ncbi:MAG: glutathione S-transferase family protein [Gammaproteobacteria bacterium]|nr:MAG: glutathione S-transferase family protein [Gammaproteobacteria bacterium]
MPFKLYTHQDSANGRKVLAISYHLNLEPEIIKVNIYQGEGQKPDYLKINPFGKIPTLIEDHFILWESNAILQYIAEKHGHFKLSSDDSEKRADIARWLFWESSHWQPAISAVLAPAVGHHLLPNLFPQPSENPNWNHPEFKHWATYLNTHLIQHDFLSNNTLTIADFSVAAMMTYFRFAKFPFDKFPALKDWYERIEALDAWKQSESKLWAVV